MGCPFLTATGDARAKLGLRRLPTRFDESWWKLASNRPVWGPNKNGKQTVLVRRVQINRPTAGLIWGRQFAAGRPPTLGDGRR